MEEKFKKTEVKYYLNSCCRVCSERAYSEGTIKKILSIVNYDRNEL